MEDEVLSCTEPAAKPAARPTKNEEFSHKETKMELARVGKKAPDFEANAYLAGKGFKKVKLSDYEGNWVVLCFYPGDFTFV